MPVDMTRYPENWKEIVATIRARAGGQCEWCGVFNHAWGFRTRGGVFMPVHKKPLIEAGCTRPPFKIDSAIGVIKIIEIVLTTAHLGVDKPDGTPGDKHDKADCRLENLAHLCQRCHLNYDRDEHKQNAAKTRRRKILEAGQMELPHA